MEIKQIGISYKVSQEFDSYDIVGKIEAFNEGNRFSAEFKVKEFGNVVLELYYVPGINTDRYTVNYFFTDSNKMTQYQNILFDFVLEAFNKLPNVNKL